MKSVFKLSSKDIFRLYTWRDHHVEEIRKNRDFAFTEGVIDVELRDTFSKIGFKQIEGGFNFSYKISNRKIFLPMVSFDYKLVEGSLGMVNMKFKIPALTNAEKEVLINDVISIFFALNYYSLKNRTTKLINKKERSGSPIPTYRTSTHNKDGKAKSISLENVKYVHSSDNKRDRGNITYHTKEWSVKGYYRHYKSGKVVFIKPSQRKRGEGKIVNKDLKDNQRIYTL